MQYRYINSELLLETWKAGVENLLFPTSLAQELNPDLHLDRMGDDLPAEREKYRKEVDAFIDQVFEIDTPEDYWSLLRKTDQTLVSLYYDRILAATFALEQTKKKMPVIEVPESWQTLSYMMLLQTFFQ